jgi:GT2 family glycosyltransferase
MSYEHFNILVVDNGSSDSSVENIRKWALGDLRHDCIYPNHVTFRGLKNFEKGIDFVVLERKEVFIGKFKSENYYDEVFNQKFGTVDGIEGKLVIIENGDNLGYAGGNNVGIRYAINQLKSEYILVLNADTVVSTNLVEKLLNVFEVENDVGICGPIEFSYDEPDYLQAAGGKFGLYTGRHELFYTILDTVRVVDWVMGSCMLIEKGVFHSCGFFDERFFLYFEEVEFAYRAKKKGYKTYVTSETCIWHKGGRKGGRTWDAVYDFYVMRNRLLFGLKHLNFFQLLIFLPIHFKKLVTFSGRDLLVYKQWTFMKRVKAIKDGFVAYNQRIKKYISNSR